MAIKKGLLWAILTIGTLFATQVANGSEPLEVETVLFQGGALSASQLSQVLMRGNYPVTNSYSPVRVHAGVDFGSTGDGVTSVYTPVSGTVTANTSACGKVAIYDGRNTIILAHMTSRTSVAAGSRIAAGTYVGKASRVVGGGCTATAAHLHIEIRVGNNISMADPTRDNSSTTLNPLSYQFDSTPRL